MKKSNLFYGFLAGCGFMLLISAKFNSLQTEEAPRHHLTFLPGGAYVYDAVTGEYRKVVSSRRVEKQIREDSFHELVRLWTSLVTLNPNGALQACDFSHRENII